MTKVSEMLLAARDLIANPEHWAQKIFSDGKRRCAIGALCNASCTVAAWNLLGDAMGLADAFSTDGASTPIGEFNDTHTHAEVLAAFNRAIGAALAEEQAQTPTTARIGRTSPDRATACEAVNV